LNSDHAHRAWFSTLLIKIKFLPSYSPNLNLIERLWKFFCKKILYNKYYDTYGKFKNKCLSFFKNINEYMFC
ncbi:MAG: transposase, partial [Candidatus Kuenenia stuttgartiensis]|nr:transposase [Candidatus Kuenenia stuttgartiensis]